MAMSSAAACRSAATALTGSLHSFRESSHGRRASPVATCSLAQRSAGTSGTCKEPTLKSDPEWPLPCPTLHPQEPEGSQSSPLGATPAFRDAQTHATSAADVVTSHAAPRMQNVGYEVQVGAARAPKFTFEKARSLRQKTRESEVHHDFMYHSGLAARLA